MGIGQRGSTVAAATLAAFALATFARGGGGESKLEVVTPREVGVIVTGMNGQGEVVGFEWVEENKTPGVVSQKPFFAKGRAMTYLPNLKGYTAVFPAAVSDAGLVVGRVGKAPTPGARTFMRTQAFVWDAEKGMRGLGVLPDDQASLASGVSRDGQRVCGLSVGENRVRACVWERVGDAWRGTALPHASGLSSNIVAMSDDGRHVASLDGSLGCLWTLDDQGVWTREPLGKEGELVPRAVNDSGTVVGLVNASDGTTQAVIASKAKGCVKIERPDGYATSEAAAINNAGVVVGTLDGPRGSKTTGPAPFLYENDKLRIITEGGKFFSAANAVNAKGQVAGVFEEPENEAEPAVEKKPD